MFAARGEGQACVTNCITWQIFRPPHGRLTGVHQTITNMFSTQTHTRCNAGRQAHHCSNFKSQNKRWRVIVYYALRAHKHFTYWITTSKDGLKLNLLLAAENSRILIRRSGVTVVRTLCRCHHLSSSWAAGASPCSLGLTLHRVENVSKLSTIHCSKLHVQQFVFVCLLFGGKTIILFFNLCINSAMLEKDGQREGEMRWFWPPGSHVRKGAHLWTGGGYRESGARQGGGCEARACHADVGCSKKTTCRGMLTETSPGGAIEAVVLPTSPSTEHQLQAGCVDGATCLLVVWFEVGGFVDCLGLSVVETKGFGARGEEFLAPEKFL